MNSQKLWTEKLSVCKKKEFHAFFSEFHTCQQDEYFFPSNDAVQVIIFHDKRCLY